MLSRLIYGARNTISIALMTIALLGRPQAVKDYLVVLVPADVKDGTVSGRFVRSARLEAWKARCGSTTWRPARTPSTTCRRRAGCSTCRARTS